MDRRRRLRQAHGIPHRDAVALQEPAVLGAAGGEGLERGPVGVNRDDPARAVPHDVVAEHPQVVAGGLEQQDVHLRVLRAIGDSKVDCTVKNNHLDEEDIDGDNVLNLTSAERDAEKWNRYVVNLADAAKFTRVGKCSVAPQLAVGSSAPDSVCWVLFRVPFRSPDDSLNKPLLRRARALRITMLSGSGLGDEEFSTVPLARPDRACVPPV